MSFLTALHGANQKRKSMQKMNPQTPKTSAGKIGSDGFKPQMQKPMAINGIKPFQMGSSSGK